MLGRRGDLTVVLKKIGEHRIGVKGHVPEHIVEDVRLRKVVELLALPDRNRGREFPQRQALKERLCRYVAVYGHCFPTCRRRQTAVYFRQVRYGFPFQSNSVSALEKDLAAVLSQLSHAALVEHSPNFVIISSVGARVLLDENRRVFYQLEQC